MKVIFLDFDGVLNSEGSFLYEHRRRTQWKLQGIKGDVSETLCNVCTSNFQFILDTYPEVKIVISSTWRVFFSIVQLKEILASYHVDSSRVIDVTPNDTTWGGNRGVEIATWLKEHPEVKHYIVIDDNDWGIDAVHPKSQIVRTDWNTGMTWNHVLEAIAKLKTPKKKKDEEDPNKPQST